MSRQGTPKGFRRLAAALRERLGRQPTKEEMRSSRRAQLHIDAKIAERENREGRWIGAGYHWQIEDEGEEL
jgi:hypothetical protein